MLMLMEGDAGRGGSRGFGWVNVAPSRGRLGGTASVMDRSSIAAGWAAGEEGNGARSMTPTFLKIQDSRIYDLKTKTSFDVRWPTFTVDGTRPKD